MRKNVLVLAFVVSLFGIGLIIPNTNFDASQSFLNKPQLFTTSGIGDNNEDYVDQLSNLHLPSDIGTHDVFNDLLAHDTNYDSLTEANQGSAGNDVLDTVDSDVTDIDSNPDIGTQGTFVNVQDLGDADYMSVQEADVGFAGINENLDCNGYDGTYSAWTFAGASPYLDAVDYTTNYIYTSGDNNNVGYFTFPSTSLTSGSATVTLYVYCMSGDGNDLASVYYNVGAGDIDTGVDVCDQTNWQYDTVNLGTLTAAQINALSIRFTSVRSPPGSEIRIDYIYINVFAAAVPDYELEFEYQFTSVDFNEVNEEVCINIQSATQGTEELEVYEWDGVSSWALLGTLNSDGWNNFTASYITSVTYYIEIRDNERTDETTQSIWNIDSIILHLWTVPTLDYELDLEVGWTAADFDEANEELCIFPVTGGGWPSEDIIVDVWNGAWTTVFADLTPDQWNNVSISSYLTGSAFEIRFLGGTETGDTTQSTWEIDAVLIHTWTPSYIPANDQAPTLDNPSDTDNMYAQYQEYQVTVYVSDQNGYADIDYLEIGLWDNTRATEYCRFRYDEDTNTFTEEYDAGTYVTLNTGSSTATESGNDIDATFYFTIDWDFPDSTDLDANCSVIDTQTESVTTWYEVNWDVETRLDYSVFPSINDGSGTADRGDLDGSFSLTGTVIYYNSVDVYPSSTAVDVWVSSTEYGSTVGPWSDLTLTSGAFDVTCYADDAVGQDTYTIKVVEEGAGSGGIDLYYTTSYTDTYIADRVQVQLYSVVDDRIDVSTSVNVDFTLYYDYDNSPVLDGTVSLNLISATDLGSGVWRITDSETTATSNTYNIVSYSGGTHGISVVDQNGLSQQVIWDEIVVQTTVADDIRVNVGDNVEIRVTLWLAYDNTFLGSGDTVTLAGQAMTWDDGNSWFDLTVSQATVGIWSYFVNSSSETTYGISALDTNSQSVGVVWDQIVVQTTVADDTRVNVGNNVEIRATLWLAYDGTFLGSGDTVTLAGLAMTWDAGNSWFDLTVSQAAVGVWIYFVNSSTETNFGITAIDTNSQSVGVVWDQIIVQTTVADDTRVNVGSNVEIRVTLWLAYDGTSLGSGDTVTLAGQAMTWDAGNSWFDLIVSQASVGQWTYFVNSSSETAFGITALDTNSQNVDVIWDQIVVQTTVADDTRVNVGDNVEIRVTLWLAYDNTFLGSGDTVTLAGQVTTWDAVNSWFDLSVSQASVGLWNYFVNSSTQTGFGITALDTNSQNVDVIWDQIVVQTTVADDTRVNVGGNVEIRVTLWLAHDSTFLGSGDTITLAGQVMTWDSVNSWFDLIVSQASVGRWNYFVNSSAETTFGISLLDPNSQSVGVIWDRIVVQTTVVDDSRINVGANAEIRVTLWLAYDSTFLGSGDTVTLAGQAMTWDVGNSWFDLSVSQLSVGLWNYFVNSSTDSTYGITLIDTNSQSVGVVWDQIIVQTTVADDTRVNVGSNIEIRVTLWLAYDSTFLGSGDTVALAGQAMTWDAGNTWFDLTVSQASVGLWNYFVNSSSETSFGITALDTSSQSAGVVWDQIAVQTTVADDARVNIGANVEIRVTLWLAYDNTFLGSGDTVTLAGQVMTWDSTNSWFDLTVSQASVGIWNYFANSSSEATFGITLLDTNSQSVGVVWDQIVVQTTGADDTRVDIGANAEIRVTLWLAYDNTFLGSGDTVTLAGQIMTWDAGNSWFDLTVSQMSVGLWSYYVNTSSDATYGITLLDTNSQSIDVIWDQIVVQTTTADDTRVNVGNNVEIRVTLWLAYDGAFLGLGDSVNVAGQAMTWDVGNSWFDLTVSQASVGLWSYFVNSTSETTFGITAFNINSQGVDVIWDQITVQSTVAIDNRVNVGSNVEVRVTLQLAYDNVFLGSGDTITLDGQTMIWDSVNSWFDLDVTQASVGHWNYFVNSSVEATFGISLLDTNSQSVGVVWDQIVVQTTVADDIRVNVGANAEIRVTLWLAYDNTFLGSGDTVTLAGQAMTWDAGNSWFDLTVSQASVNLWNYYVNSSSDSNYGITLLDTNSQSVGVIWDQIVVQSTIADDTRVDIGANAEIRVTLWLAYDNTFLGSGDTVTLAGQAMTWDAGNSWFDLTVSQASIGLWNYFVNSSSEATFGISLLDTNSQSVGVVWDQIVIQTTVADDARVGIGDNVEIRVTLCLAYDSTFLGSGDTVTLAGQVMTWDAGNSWFDLSVSQLSIGLWTYYVNSSAQTGFGITTLDTNSQSVNVIWDQIVITIGVDDSTPLNGIQVNFTLAIMFDYDNIACTTYQIVIQRNSTWWHSFTESNKSQFIDTNSDTSYTYTVMIVTSESTYNVLSFSTNSQQVVWSAAPNSAPVNDSAPDLANPDDTDNLYARYTYYVITSSVSDIDGYNDIEYIELTLYDNSRASPVWTVRYTVSGNIFSVESGSTYITLSASSFAVGAGNNLDVTWYIKIGWDHSDLTDVDMKQYVYDGIIGDEDFYESNWDVETRLEITGLTIDDGSGTSNRGPLDGAFTVSGTLIFLNSVDNYPLGNETDVWVSSSEYGTSTGPWSDLTLTSGQFSLTVYADDEVGQDTLTIKAVVEGGGSSGTDLLNSTAQSTYIADRIAVQSYAALDPRININDAATIDVELLYEYDSSPVMNGSVTINGIAATHQGSGTWRFSDTKSSVQSFTYNVVAYSGGIHGLNQVNQNAMTQDVIWDQIVVQTTVANDTRVDVGANVEIRVTLWLAYDSSFLGSGDTVTLAGSAMTWDFGEGRFELIVSQASVGSWTYFVNSSSESTYGITSLNLSGSNVSVIWDRIQVQSYSMSDGRVNVGESVDIDVNLYYDYDDSPVTDGTITVNGAIATHQGTGLWRFSDSEVVVVMNTYNLVVCSGNIYGLTAVDQNSQSLNVIWDQLVIVIGVDDPSSLNGHQANFTLSVTFDYDDSVCTTYQIVVDRNATWWHSFTTVNLSSFVDTSTNTTYLYNVSLVSSESTYGITAFSTNTLQVTWSLAPNEVPVNDFGPVLTNADDTDYLYARYRYYVITTSVSDLNGYADISYVELTLYSDDQLTQYWTVRYTVGTGIFSVESGGTNIAIGSVSNAVGVGDTLTIIWYIKINWDHPDVVDSDVNQYVTDGTASNSDFYESNWNVETRLDYSVFPALSDDRGDINTGNLFGTGAVTYYGSSISPRSNETDVWIVHDLAGTWSGNLLAGSFNISSISSAATVRMNTYTFKIVAEGVGSGGTDLYYTTSLTDTFVTDRIEIYEAGVVDGRININSDCEVWWRARYEYSSTEIQSGLAIELVGSKILVWDAGNLYWRWIESSIIPDLVEFEVASASESTYGLTAWFNTTPVQQVIWDSLVITITDPIDQRINVGTNASGIVVSAVYAFDGTPYDGSFILNNTNYQFAIPQIQGYTVLSCSGDTYDITAIGINDETYCIWDRVFVVSLDADELYHDPNDDVIITVELQYEFDSSSVEDGMFLIAGHPLTHIGLGIWEAQVTIADYQTINFDSFTMCNATVHGISAYNMNSNGVAVYWDRLEFYSVSVDDGRINVGSSSNIQWSVRLENAGVSITSGLTAEMTGGITLTPSAGFYTATVTEGVIGSVSYGILTATIGEIDQFTQSASDAVVIWDRVSVASIQAYPLSLDAATATEIRVTLVYEFDSTEVTDGEVYLNDNGASVAMSYNSAGGYWSASITKTTAGNYTFIVGTVLGNTHGISSLSTGGLSVEVEWVAVPGFTIDPMTLMLIGGVGIGVIGAAIVASRRGKRGDAAAVSDVELADFGVPEPAEPTIAAEPEIVESEAEAVSEEIKAEETELIEPEVSEVPEIEAESVEEVVELEEVELPPVDEEIGADIAIIEPAAEVVEETPEAVEIELPEAKDLEIEAEPSIPEEPLTEVAPEIEESIDEVEVKPEFPEYEKIPEEFIEPAPEVDLTKLTKKELLDLIPADIRESTSPNELKRLTKQELISLVESFRDVEE